MLYIKLQSHFAFIRLYSGLLLDLLAELVKFTMIYTYTLLQIGGGIN